MPIPYDKIREDLKTKKLTRIGQLLDYAEIKEWEEEIGFRKGALKRLIDDPKRFELKDWYKISVNTGLKESVIKRLITGQKKYNWAMKRGGDRKG